MCHRETRSYCVRKRDLHLKRLPGLGIKPGIFLNVSLIFSHFTTELQRLTYRMVLVMVLQLHYGALL
jgi:hypothetical protein